MIANSIKAELDEAEHVIRQQMARIAELEVEVENLKAGLSAHEVLQSIYRNSAAPEGHRIKAAQAALPHEVPRLAPQRPPLELAAEEIEPLAVVVERQRKRMDRMQGQDIKVLPNGQVLLLKPGSNGSDDDDSGD